MKRNFWVLRFAATVGIYLCSSTCPAALEIAYVDGDAGVSAQVSTGRNDVFTSITAALEAVDYAGRVIIRSSGVFHEPLVIRLSSSKGLQVPLIEASPGVVAVLDAFDDREDPSSVANNARFLGTAIKIVNANFVVLRNLVIRNWNTGINYKGRDQNGGVLLENCRFENCFLYGLRARGMGQITARNCQAVKTGSRSYRGEYTAARFNAGVSFQFENLIVGRLYDNTLLGADHAVVTKSPTAEAALVLSNNIIADRIDGVVSAE